MKSLTDWHQEVRTAQGGTMAKTPCGKRQRIAAMTSKHPFMKTAILVFLRQVLVRGFGTLVLSAFQVLSAEPETTAPGVPPVNPGRGARDYTPEHPRQLAPYFAPSTSTPKAPDRDGFLPRWLLLEPISKPNRSNTVFTDSYIRNAFTTEYFANQFTVVPRAGDKVTVAGQELLWHALDSSQFNVKLFRFADGINKPTYGVLFWAVTVVESPREQRAVRMAVGSNSASMWWLNGKEAVILSGDRRMVMDDGVSKRLTLNPGKNIIRGAVINGPGMSDFCVRFLNEQGEPIRDITVNLENTGH
jgi:hypothetical protein